MELEHKLRFFLIDYENVHDGGLKGHELLTPEDTVIIFCSEHASSLNGLTLASMQQRGISFQIKNSQTGTKNAMDFQLATEVGRLIGMNHDGHKCVIISGDQGFQALRQYWKAERVLVSIQPSIQAFLDSLSPAPKAEKTPAPVKPAGKAYPFLQHPEFAAAVSRLSVSEQEKEKIFNQLQRSRSVKDSGKRKQQFHTVMCQTYGQKQGSQIYNSIKELMK